jgi:small conductance mechanosensitive channel
MDLSKLSDGAVLVETYLIPWGGNLLSALVVFVLGRWVAKAIGRGLARVMGKTGVEPTLANFLDNVLYAALLAVVAIASLDQLGVDTASALAVFATAGLAVGLALKDSLSNFAAGVMLIMLKPFKAGDFIDAGGVTGTVDTIQMSNTILTTPDNREVSVPNADLLGGTITNFSARDTRRIDLLIGIGYDDDIDLAKRLLSEILAADPRVLDDPAPFIGVSELGDSSVNIATRPWVARADYWATHCDLLETIKKVFDANGVSIPYPQQDVHMHTVS